MAGLLVNCAECGSYRVAVTCAIAHSGALRSMRKQLYFGLTVVSCKENDRDGLFCILSVGTHDDWKY